jgi:hypothetical protein
VQYLEHARRQSGGAQRLGKALGRERRLRGMLQNHDIAGHERRHDAVHRDEVRIVPRRHGEDHAQRLAPHEAFEIVFGARLHIRERLGRDCDHVTRTLERAAHFVWRELRRTTHLPGELLGDRRAAPLELLAETREDCGTLGKRCGAPVRERHSRGAQRGIDLRGSRERTFNVHAPIYRAHRFLDDGGAHMISK